MKKSTLIKLALFLVACLLIIPMAVACGDDAPPVDSTANSTPSSTPDSKEEVETVTVTFDPGNGEFDPDDFEGEIEVEKGEKIPSGDWPKAVRKGYTFLGWYLDEDMEEKCAKSRKFTKDTDLYAGWEKEGSTDSTPGSDNGGSSTPDSGNTGDSTPGSGTGGGTTEITDPVVVYYQPNQNGYFENEADYEKTINRGGRITRHPTPVNDNQSLQFVGWYTDSACTVPVDTGTKYMEDETTLYGKWNTMPVCLDGSFNHNWGLYYEYKAPTCTEPGQDAQDCAICQRQLFTTGRDALGHEWGNWEEGFMQTQRSCARLGCTGFEFKKFNNITTACIDGGKVSVEGPGTIFDVSPSQLYNGTWDEKSDSGTISGRGDGTFSIVVNFGSAMTVERIYFKGRGGGSVSVYVQYEGESDYKLVGNCGFVSVPEDGTIEDVKLPFANVDITRKVVAVKFTQENPPKGTTFWEEFAFVTTEEAE